MVKIVQRADEMVTKIAAALEEVERAYPDTECALYRYNSGAVRVRVISQSFEGVSVLDRQDLVMDVLQQHLDDDTRDEISLLLCLAPNERSLLSLEFEDPTPSQL